MRRLEWRAPRRINSGFVLPKTCFGELIALSEQQQTPQSGGYLFTLFHERNFIRGVNKQPPSCFTGC
jgi:hypothetical protein